MISRLDFTSFSVFQISNMPAQVPDSQLLVEKIVKLQREMARRQEKVEFMEEHISTMVEEMKKKNRLIQHFMLMQESGMLSSDDMEDHKVNKDLEKSHESTETQILSNFVKTACYHEEDS